MMDKNQITGLVLIMAMLMGYQFFFAPKEEPLKPQEKAKIAQTSPNSPAKIAPIDSSVAKSAAGDFATAALGTAKDVVLENKDIRVTFTSQGGRVKNVLLKNYDTYNSFNQKKKEPLTIFDESFDKISLELPTTKGNIDLNKLYFSTNSVGGTVAEGKTDKVVFTLQLANGQTVEQSYSLAGSGFLLDNDLKLTGLDGILKNESVKEITLILYP